MSANERRWARKTTAEREHLGEALALKEFVQCYEEHQHSELGARTHYSQLLADLDAAIGEGHSSKARQIPTAGRGRILSRGFLLELKKLLSLSHNWDGFEGAAIPPEIAQHVEDLALEGVRRGFPEPEVTAASDGSLGVDWKLGSGVIVGVFVSAPDVWEPVAIISPESIREESVNNDEDFWNILEANEIATEAPVR